MRFCRQSNRDHGRPFRPQSPCRSPLRLECLEDRQLPSASLNLFTRELLIDHTAATRRDQWQVAVRYTSGTITVHETRYEGLPGETMFLRETIDSQFPLVLVWSVNIRLGPADDRMTLTALPAWVSVSADGGSGSDSLRIERTADITWSVTDNNAGTADTVRFTSVENLDGGGTIASKFVFADGKRVAGAVTGSNDFDFMNKVDFSAWTSPVRLFEGIDFHNVALLIGGRSAGDTIIGGGAWEITGQAEGNVNDVAWYDFENLQAGSGVSQFVFSDGASIQGWIDGGSNRLTTADYSAYRTPVVVNLSAGWATGAAGGLHGVRNVIGGRSTGDQFAAGIATGSITWTITDTNSGSVGAVSFSSFECLQGGDGADEFVFRDSMGVTGWLNGGGGRNVLNYLAYVTPVTVRLFDGAATGVALGASSFGTVIGGSASDTLIGDDLNNILVGGTGDDTIDGRGGRDLVIGGAGARPSPGRLRRRHPHQRIHPLRQFLARADQPARPVGPHGPQLCRANRRPADRPLAVRRHDRAARLGRRRADRRRRTRLVLGRRRLLRAAARFVHPPRHADRLGLGHRPTRTTGADQLT